MLAELRKTPLSHDDAINHLMKHQFNIDAALEEIKISSKRGKGLLNWSCAKFFS